ncbi:hypothetical protein EST38_g11815 [Candolleomyces aberdarensis]|uniref:HAT C-terminal dimerisation domain-containing protein n=1 Tax=Candolleomyces aberdarensis TaxID=2316362 RepID=A0A4Q2D4N1_9AGAR|nr:hypothetical protein EST38_g11815 [Candolleomyces aberdarensis]
MPPRAQGGGRGSRGRGRGARGRGTHGRGTRGQSHSEQTHAYPNGSSETTFAVNLPSPTPPQATDTDSVVDAEVSGPLADASENPFLSSASEPCSDSVDPGASDSVRALAALHAVACPELQRPRAGPHSPARGHRSRFPAESVSGSSSDTDSDSGSESHSEARTKRYNASDVWHFFKQNPGSKRYNCIFCLSKAAAGALGDHECVRDYDKMSGTGTMRRHLYGHHLNDWVKECDRQDIKIMAKSAQKYVDEYRKDQGGLPASEAEGTEHKVPEFTPDAFIEALVDFIVADDQSINVIESVFFRRLLLLLRADLRDEDIPHRTFVQSHIQARWDVYMKELQAQLQNSVGKISLTTDLWSDPNLCPFMAVTAHWIESRTILTAEGPVTSLVLREDLIAFHNMPGRHTGEHLGTALLHVLDRLKIAAKIGWVTLDNASNNETMMEHLEFLLDQRQIVFSAKDNRICCFPHITNLACKAVLDAITNIGLADVNDDEVDPEREVISTAPNRDIIAHTRSLIRTQLLSYEKIPTLYQALPHFHRMVAAWERKKESMPRYENVIDAGIKKLQDYLDNIEGIPAYTLAILVTPTIKLAWHHKHQKDDVVQVTQLFVDSLKTYRRQMGINTPAPRRVVTTTADAWTMDALGSPVMRADNHSRSIQAEVDAYLADGRIGCGSTLKFWQENREEYPTIYQLAMDILPIAGSAVPCERVFSSAKETMTSRRGRIRPVLMEALQMLKFSLKGSLDFTAGTGREAEIETLEGSAAQSGRLPDDITTYINHLLHGATVEEDSDEEDDDSGEGAA